MHPCSRILVAGSCALLLAGAACARDAVSPDDTAVTTARVRADREHDDDGHGTGWTATFEDFTLGAIDGQHDWQATGARGGPGCAVYDHEISDNTSLATARNREGSFGRQSLRISNAVTSGCYADQTFSHRSTDVAGEQGAWSRSRDGLVDYALAGARLRNHFEVEWSVMSASPAAWQPGLEVVASPARGDDHRMSWVQMADWADGVAIVFAERSDPAAPGDFQRVTVVRGLDRRSAYRLKLTMDFRDGPANDVVRLFVDGTLRHAGGSWETYYALDANGRANFGGSTPAVNRVMFRTGSDTHRGVPGDAAPATRGRGFLIDGVRVAAFSVAASADACREGGWRDLRDDSGHAFDNQGDCVSLGRHAFRRDATERSPHVARR